MSVLLETSSVFPELATLKRELYKLRDILPIIVGRYGDLTFSRAEEIAVEDTPNETIKHIDILPFKTEGSIFNLFAQWFIYRAFAYAGEGKPDKIHAFCGVVGESGQYLDYLHSDPMQLRITSTVVDLSCLVNPSTLVANNGDSRVAMFENMVEADIPADLFIPQKPEGEIVGFVDRQYHLEKQLPLGSAKIFMSATFNRFD